MVTGFDRDACFQETNVFLFLYKKKIICNLNYLQLQTQTTKKKMIRKMISEKV